MVRSDESLRAAHELPRLGLLNDAVSCAYFAPLHVARAGRALLEAGRWLND